ncbi:thiamine pyrophosphate-dependent enzyme [Mesorhizobium caraganae]|uniref:thiamine pyrophosphate-dependent enzyme n=1 Tax=Mesorhizobium caraganae TaxID=483206 RepID=UPI0024845DC9|nr:thiamine pyrophosphate-dependent enzyme [Mesorhizobium caraganae]
MVLASAGGIVGELTKGWRVTDTYGFDCEMGSSTMGYEIAGGWGAAMAREDGDVFVILGDGSYMDDEFRHLFECPDRPRGRETISTRTKRSVRGISSPVSSAIIMSEGC